MADLPFFEQYSGNKLKLVSELEEENNESKLDNTIGGGSGGTTPGQINIKGKPGKTKGEGGCKC